MIGMSRVRCCHASFRRARSRPCRASGRRGSPAATGWTSSNSSASCPERALQDPQAWLVEQRGKGDQVLLEIVDDQAVDRVHGFHARPFRPRPTGAGALRPGSAATASVASRSAIALSGSTTARFEAPQRRRRHDRSGGALRFLDHGHAAGALDRLRPLGAVLVGAGEKHSQQTAAIDVGRRLEQARRWRAANSASARRRTTRCAVRRRSAGGSRAARSTPFPARPAPCPRLRRRVNGTCRWKMSTSRLGRSRGRCSDDEDRRGAGRRAVPATGPAAPRRRPADAPMTTASTCASERRERGHGLPRFW